MRRYILYLRGMFQEIVLFCILTFSHMNVVYIAAKATELNMSQILERFKSEENVILKID